MKKKGNVCDYTAAKNEELVKTFNAKLRDAAIVDLDEIYRQVAESPASRFFISEERAYELLVRHERTGSWQVTNPLRAEMLDAIRSIAIRLRKADPSLTLRDAVFAAVNSPAPKFYLTPRSCRTLIYAAKKRYYAALRRAEGPAAARPAARAAAATTAAAAAASAASAATTDAAATLSAASLKSIAKTAI